MSPTTAILIAILKETAQHESRVAASPETVKKYITLGAKVIIEKSAGANAAIPDSDFKAAGADIVDTAQEAKSKADIVLCVQGSVETLNDMKENSFLIGQLSPHNNEDFIQKAAAQKISTFSMELVPRITRAQSMDVLSSQSNLAGYKAVLDATEHYGKSFPMMMTAAGTVPPAKAFVMGAGVAGLQAIATAKRLGAIVSATDVRPAAKEQVQSLGGNFIAVEDDEFKEAETAGGYAKEMSDAYKKKQAALVEETLAKQDIVITTALIPGRPAPKLITEKMVKSMKPGSVIVDLAAPTGGNCALTKADKVVKKHGVTIIGHSNTASRLAAAASALYAKNLLNLVTLMVDAEDKKLNVDWDDDIIQGIALTKDGKKIHPNFGGKKPTSQKNNTKTDAKSDAETDTKNTKEDAA